MNIDAERIDNAVLALHILPLLRGAQQRMMTHDPIVPAQRAA